jgi:HB1/ASXL restriction endonuclease-like protein with HTH domain
MSESSKTKKKANAKAKVKQSATKGQDGPWSCLNAAAKVLAEKGEPMNCKEMIEAMATKGYWTTPGGKTPHATLYSSIAREIRDKGKESRFKKADRGKFASYRSRVVGSFALRPGFVLDAWPEGIFFKGIPMSDYLPVPLSRRGGLDPESAAARLLRAFLNGRKTETITAYRQDLEDFQAFIQAPSLEQAA